MLIFTVPKRRRQCVDYSYTSVSLLVGPHELPHLVRLGDGSGVEHHPQLDHARRGGEASTLVPGTVTHR